MASLLAFPGRVNLSTWQGRTAGGDDDDVATCANSPGAAGTLMITEAGCNFRWSYNATDRKLRRRKGQRQQQEEAAAHGRYGSARCRRIGGAAPARRWRRAPSPCRCGLPCAGRRQMPLSRKFCAGAL